MFCLSSYSISSCPFNKNKFEIVTIYCIAQVLAFFEGTVHCINDTKSSNVSALFTFYS